MTRILAVGIVLSYNTWIGFGLNGRPDALAGYTSELAAADQPYGWLFRAGDVTAAVLLAIMAAWGWRAWAKWLGTPSRWLALAIGTFSAATALDSLFNMPCAPTFDASCRAAEQANPFSIDHLPHVIASVTTGLALMASLGIVLTAVAKPGWGRAAWAVLGLGLVIGALLLATIGWQFAYNYGHGYFQVPQVVAASLWFGYLSLKLKNG